MSHLESAMLWAPVEAMTQSCRNSQKFIAKDLTSVTTAMKAIAALVPKKDAAAGAAEETKATAVRLQMAQKLSALIKEVQGLKRKLEDADRASTKYSRQARARLHYLRGVEALAAAESKNGAQQPEHEIVSMEEEQEEEEEEEDNARVQASPPSPRSRAAAASSTRNLSEDTEMEIDAGSRISPQPAAPASSLSLSSTAVPPAQRPGAGSAAAAAVADFAPDEFEVTPQLRLDRMFGEHLLRTNRHATAAKLIASQPPLQLLLDSDMFAAARRVESSLLESGDCTRALAWCGENRSRLAKINCALEFDMRLQEFLALVKKGEPMAAIEYARKHLAPAATATPAAPQPGAAAAGNEEEKAHNGVAAAAEPASGTRNNAASSASAAGDDKKASSASAAAGSAAPSAAAADDNGPAPIVDPERVRILGEAMNLLVFFNFADASSGGLGAWGKYRVYWSSARFRSIAASFRAAHRRILGLPARSSLEYVMRIGLGAMKTTSCRCAHEQAPNGGTQEHFGSGDALERSDTGEDKMDESKEDGSHVAPSPASSCPVCTFPLSCLASSLPVASRTHSRLVCRLSGQLMDERNPPLALPNGYVYSRAALTNMAAQTGGIITCPRSKFTCTLAQTRIAYIL